METRRLLARYLLEQLFEGRPMGRNEFSTTSSFNLELIADRFAGFSVLFISYLIKEINMIISNNDKDLQISLTYQLHSAQDGVRYKI
jgi:hypothetical protein